MNNKTYGKGSISKKIADTSNETDIAKNVLQKDFAQQFLIKSCISR